MDKSLGTVVQFERFLAHAKLYRRATSTLRPYPLPHPTDSVETVKAQLVQLNCGLASNLLQQNFFQRHLIVGWLCNNILKIRQNRFGETCEKSTIKIFNFHHRKSIKHR